MAAISVVIALRNRSGTRLENCIRSLRWQTLGGAEVVEIVLSDFGSEPGHAASVKQLAQRHSCVVVATDTDEVWNRSRALNIGVQAASADLVMCTDADMIFAPTFLQHVVQVHADGADAMVVSRCHDLPETVAEQPWEVANFPELRAKATLRDTTGTGACQAARRTFFHEVRGYDEAFKYWGAEDDDMLARATKRGLEIRWLPLDVTMLHQWHPTMKNDRWLQRKVNEWRLRLTRHKVVKNRSGWGTRGPHR